MNLTDFEDALKTLMNGDSFLRPFICNGSPLECDSFIVGLNPATELPKPFWSYWESANGFRKDIWFQDYVSHRMSKPLKPGKTRRNPVSTTRKIIEKIVNGVPNHKFLETNIYSKDSSQYSDLQLNDKNTEIFKYLVDTIKPKLMILHGQDSHIIGKSMSLNAKVICVSHFAGRDGSWSNVNTESFIASLKSV